MHRRGPAISRLALTLPFEQCNRVTVNRAEVVVVRVVAVQEVAPVAAAAAHQAAGLVDNSRAEAFHSAADGEIEAVWCGTSLPRDA